MNLKHYKKTKEIKIFKAFAGIGSQFKALKNISKSMNWTIKHVGMVEWFVDAIIGYVAIHSENINPRKEDLEKAKKHKGVFFDKLRKYQKTLMEIEKSELIKKYKKPFNYFNDFVVGSESPNCEYAHILPVKEIKKRDKSEWFKVADNNNCLLLNPSFHTALDKFQIIINENGEFKSSQDDSRVIFKIKKEVLNNKRLEYIREFIDFSKTRR